MERIAIVEVLAGIDERPLGGDLAGEDDGLAVARAFQLEAQGLGGLEVIRGVVPCLLDTKIG
jgi:hypothetical protein